MSTGMMTLFPERAGAWQAAGTCKFSDWRVSVAFVLLALAFASPASAVPSQEPRPNFLVILADDLGWADLGQDGSRIDTPHLDRLAREGVKLTNFRASAPMCSPTRAALLTGRYPHSVGMPELASPQARGDVPSLALDHSAITMPQALKAGGYRSALIGKWHLGFGPANAPRTYGFDEFWGSLIGTPMYWQPQETFHNETPIPVTGYFTDALADRAVQWLRTEVRPDRPFLLYLAFNAPHYPLEAPAELVYKYRRRFPDRGLFAIYAAMIEQMDAGIGRVLSAIDDLKAFERTFVVFTSDNGPSAEPKHYGPEGADFSNGPLRGFKFGVHEGGLRVPFIARWPGRLPAGAVRDGAGVTMDILPTLMEAAGIQPAPGHKIDGISLLPLLRGEPFKRPESLHWENQQNAAVLDGDWKLVLRYWLPRPLLYRLADDVGEQNDLAAMYPDRVAAMLVLHERWKADHYPNPLPRHTKRSSYFFPSVPTDP